MVVEYNSDWMDVLSKFEYESRKKNPPLKCFLSCEHDKILMMIEQLENFDKHFFIRLQHENIELILKAQNFEFVEQSSKSYKVN